MKQFRRIVFWLHLASGALAGIFIFIMCVTGALLSFESNIVEYAESGAKTIAVSERGAARVALSELLVNAAAAKPGVQPTAIAFENRPDATAAVSFGREGQVFVDPYTGEITGESAEKLRAAFGGIEDAHRWLSMSDAGREFGKSVMDAANLLFLFLAVSGVYIWFPRRFAWKNFRSVLWFRKDLRGRARDFNWHNTIGFWTSLVLVVLTATAVVMSYKWANDLLYRATGNEPPPQQQRRQPEKSNEPVILPESANLLFEKARTHVPEIRSVSLNLPIKNGEAVFSISEGRYWNRFARSTLTLDAGTGEIMKFEDYGEQNLGRRLRSWARFTHTGETGGFLGQLIGFVACIGGAFLVWTGFSLSLRRYKTGAIKFS